MMRMLRATGLLAALVALSARVAGGDAPAVPKEIAVPAGYARVLTLHAKGVQIYKSVAGKDGKLKWELEAPLADLADDKGARVGHHFGAPTLGVPAWEANDGSRLVRDKAEDVKSAPAKKPETDIPWLLVRVKSDDGSPGVLAKAVYVQRIQTEGGKAPADAPKRADTRIGVPYTATYVFYARAE
ncbi:DUF3455 domain-containing protein [Frigoriglobus tundricola]|uniref:DUF3455 domain-containing protein n=1 Tax=Frigoriglobus tundricola TaxID=2774151 RepID=A0A6M5YPC0_9BACT|nr:DUF3455 domain-containing protein [Frigoriglobus tundricola]QJW95071.1 hypothetical protein FTUN_2597 [Frigoriglobus tundricola]